MKKITALLVSLILSLSLTLPAAAYSDIPAGSALGSEVERAVSAGLMKGYSDTRFGYSDSMTRMQFVTVLSRMADRTAVSKASLITPEMGVDADALAARSPEFYAALNRAVAEDIVDTSVSFRPNDPITRGEMAEMLVRFLGLKGAAQLAERNIQLPFTDVTRGKGYIAIAYDIGMTRGTSASTFAPNATATRAQAAAMLLRIHDKLEQELSFSHGFYAISSRSQLDLARKMDAVSAGWSRLTWDGTTALLATTSANQNEFCIPSGYQDVVTSLHKNNVRLHLNVYMDTSGGAADLLASADGRKQAIDQIIHELTITYRALGANPYDGVTLDLEGLRAAQRDSYNAFLQELSTAVHGLGKTLYVCVAPVLTTGSYFDGYDYATIGTLADRVILMAYDYDAHDMTQFLGTDYQKTAATAPMDQVYWSLRTAAKQIDPAKLLLGFSAKHTAWEIDESGKLVTTTPHHPDTQTVAKRLAQPDTELGWSRAYQQSYAIYRGDGGKRYFLWYQDNASVTQAMQTAKLLGITGCSFWRLGQLPQTGSWSWNSLLA